MNYLHFHYESLKGKEMLASESRSTSGLCDYFEDDELFELIMPSSEEIYDLKMSGKSSYFWASGSNNDLPYRYTPLRQNIVLLMAAMAGEL